jgi:hypothetical protein
MNYANVNYRNFLRLKRFEEIKHFLYYYSIYRIKFRKEAF